MSRFNALIFFFLLFGLIGCSSVAPVVKRSAGARTAVFVVWTTDMRADLLRNSYRAQIKTPDNQVTGLCMLKKNGDEWRGTFMNEMGVRAFDFIVTDEKCELLNVISMMDKWYIKKTVAADFFFFFNVDVPGATFQKSLKRFEQNGMKVVNYKKKQLIVHLDGSLLLINRRHNLQYELRKIYEIDPEKVIL
jgi:hypothetical protein